MNSLKHHLSLIIPLLALLFSLESIILLDRAIKRYEQNLGKSYSIIIASRSELSIDDVRLAVGDAEGLVRISTDGVLEKLKRDISSANLSILQDSLPKFYSLALSRFPDRARLRAIEASLKRLSGVERVESFAKSHDQLYQLLLLLKGGVVIFVTLIAVISLLLMSKQIELWRFEHSERMEIMGYFGAPSWMRNGLLFRLALIDSLIATLFISGGVFYISRDSSVLSLLGDVGLDASIFTLREDSLLLLASGVGISMLSVFVVIAFKRS
ncbi:MAG: cell division protein FtsX [Wolinella sp.]